MFFKIAQKARNYIVFAIMWRLVVFFRPSQTPKGFSLNFIVFLNWHIWIFNKRWRIFWNLVLQWSSSNKTIDF
ncbi:MAG: hypothetical protein C4523_21475 [Myxococcales bacterium]|nr:MAG: hypothetical protein C4523_21475 [Myxococcales bacterium]